jgi:hypothetical protein
MVPDALRTSLGAASNAPEPFYQVTAPSATQARTILRAFFRSADGPESRRQLGGTRLGVG